MMNRFAILVLLCLGLQACMKRKYADLVVHNAVIHVLDEENSLGEAMAIKDGKIVEVGPERQILNKYRWGKSIDAGKRHIYPGLTDASSHIIYAFMETFQQPGTDKVDFNASVKLLQKQLLRYGVVEVHEMGIDSKEFEFLKAADAKGILKLKIYAALNPTEENYQFAQRFGMYRTQNLVLRGFQFGIEKASEEDFNQVTTWAKRCAELNYQLTLLPSSNWKLDELRRELAQLYSINPDHRWRFIHTFDVTKDFSTILKQNGVYSIVPCQVVADSSFIAQSKPVNKHISVNFQEIISGFGVFALGLNLNSEVLNPYQNLHTFFSQNQLAITKAETGETYRLTLDDAIKSITTWPQFAAFSEETRGALTEGMEATFFVAKFPISNDVSSQSNASVMTFIRGEKVFDAQEGY